MHTRGFFSGHTLPPSSQQHNFSFLTPHDLTFNPTLQVGRLLLYTVLVPAVVLAQVSVLNVISTGFLIKRKCKEKELNAPEGNIYCRCCTTAERIQRESFKKFFFLYNIINIFCFLSSLSILILCSRGNKLNRVLKVQFS